jgi:5'-3' exonuclease
VLNVLRTAIVKFRGQYGEIVLCDDNRNYWRKEVFPYYKASRKVARSNIKIDWKRFFESMAIIKGELQETFPYKYINVDGAEADDIISVLVRNFTDRSILIISSDKDFIQLHNENTKQYDLINSKWVSSRGADNYLFEHIISGDRGDGIPNIASDDNIFVIKGRQKRVTEKLKQTLVDIDSNPDHPLYRNWIRNKMLIDLTSVPKNIHQKVIAQYNQPRYTNDRSKLLKYFATHNLTDMMQHISDF